MQIAHIAKLIELPIQTVETTLSQVCVRGWVGGWEGVCVRVRVQQGAVMCFLCARVRALARVLSTRACVCALSLSLSRAYSLLCGFYTLLCGFYARLCVFYTLLCVLYTLLCGFYTHVRARVRALSFSLTCIHTCKHACMHTHAYTCIHTYEHSLMWARLHVHQMILDKKFNGILDQGSGALIAYEDIPDNTTLETGIEAIEQV